MTHEKERLQEWTYEVLPPHELESGVVPSPSPSPEVEEVA